MYKPCLISKLASGLPSKFLPRCKEHARMSLFNNAIKNCSLFYIRMDALGRRKSQIMVGGEQRRRCVGGYLGAGIFLMGEEG